MNLAAEDKQFAELLLEYKELRRRYDKMAQYLRLILEDYDADIVKPEFKDEFMGTDC